MHWNLWWGALALCVLMGCDGEATTPDESAAVGPASGAYHVQVKIVDVGGIEMPFQFEVVASEARIDRLVLRAVDPDGVLSAELAEVQGIAVGPDGAFHFRLDFTLPADFSPSGSALELSLVFEAQSTGAGFCGTVSGEIFSLDIELSQTTFNAAPWGDEGATPLSACVGEDVDELPRLTRDRCPTLAPGLAVELYSGGYERRFELYLPEAAAPASGWPVVVLYHGFTSSAEGVRAATEMQLQVTDGGFALVVPQSRGDAGLEWDSLSADDSPDLAFFDDLLTCLDGSIGVDAGRVHVAGMSGGGLHAAYLGVFRPEVVASVAAMSGGLIPPYPGPTRRAPFLIGWGGIDDVAFDQNFDQMATDLSSILVEAGHSVVACNHGQGHRWGPAFTPWVLRFLLDHPLGERAEEGALPEIFPDYCARL